MSVFLDRIKRQILDEDRRNWSTKDTKGNVDLFQVEYLKPLRELEALGYFRLLEHKGAVRGRKRVDRVEILGEVEIPDE